MVTRNGRFEAGEVKVGSIIWKRIHAGGGLFNGPIIRVTEIQSGQLNPIIIGVVLEQQDGPWPMGSEFLGGLPEFQKPEDYEGMPPT